MDEVKLMTHFSELMGAFKDTPDAPDWCTVRIAELEARDAILRAAVDWFEKERPQWGPGTLPTWYVDATR